MRDRIRRQADAIEAELKSVGYWQSESLKPEQYKFARPYAADTMAFPQWLQFIFLPRVRDLLGKSDQAFPSGSAIGAYAAREMDGDPRAGRLVELLSAFDALIAPVDDDFYASTTHDAATAQSARRRMSLAAVVLAWTVLIAVLGALFALALPRLMPSDREEIVTFSASQPQSQAYELLAFTLRRSGRADAAQRERLEVRLYRGSYSPQAAELTIDPMTFDYHYTADGGQPRSGKLNADAVLAWMDRNQAAAPDRAAGAHLQQEAAEVVRLAEASRSEDSLEALLPSLSSTGAAASRPSEVFQFSIPKRVVNEKAPTIGPWLRWGVPCAVWLLGIIAILLRGWLRA